MSAKINEHTPLVQDPSLICMEQMSVFLQGKHRERLTFPCSVSPSTKPEIDDSYRTEMKHSGSLSQNLHVEILHIFNIKTFVTKMNLHKIIT